MSDEPTRLEYRQLYDAIARAPLAQSLRWLPATTDDVPGLGPARAWRTWVADEHYADELERAIQPPRGLVTLQQILTGGWEVRLYVPTARRRERADDRQPALF
jgi:hypothetical protein